MKQVQVIKWLIQNFYILLIVSLIFLVVIFWRYSQIAENFQPEIIEEVVTTSNINEPIQPIPLINKVNDKKAKLGGKLFSEKLLSHSNQFSCATCHNLSTGGIDRDINDNGIKGVVGPINIPTIFNSKFNFRQYWDGNAETLADQAYKRVQRLPLMGSSWSEAIAKLNKVPEYVQDFAQIYPDGITANNVSEAIATFEETLTTPNSRFDKFLRGETNAITEAEKTGYMLFKSYGCVSCHQGVNVGGNMFQKFGVMETYAVTRGTVTQKDLGRFNVTQNGQDLYVFKVPSLRNVAITPPYFHDSSAPTLEKAVGVMAKYQLGRELSGPDVALIIKFLQTLTGEYQGKSL